MAIPNTVETITPRKFVQGAIYVYPRELGQIPPARCGGDNLLVTQVIFGPPDMETGKQGPVIRSRWTPATSLEGVAEVIRKWRKDYEWMGDPDQEKEEKKSLPVPAMLRSRNR